MLQERLYIIEHKGDHWRVRLDQLDRPASLHATADDAVEATMRSVKRLAPCRIRVVHSGQVEAEWTIRYPDGAWASVEYEPPWKRPRGWTPQRQRA